MQNLNNLPPFYIGQKVVALLNYTGKSGAAIIKDEIYSVFEITKIKNQWSIKISLNGNYWSIINSQGIIFFAPAQKETFPIIELSKVIEKEKKLISSN